MSPHPGLCVTAGAEHSHAEELSRQNKRDLESGILWQLGLTPGSHAPSEISPKRVRGPGHTSKGVLQLQLGLHRLGHPPAHPCQGSHSGGAAQGCRNTVPQSQPIWFFTHRCPPLLRLTRAHTCLGVPSGVRATAPPAKYLRRPEGMLLKTLMSQKNATEEMLREKPALTHSRRASTGVSLPGTKAGPARTVCSSPLRRLATRAQAWWQAWPHNPTSCGPSPPVGCARCQH